MPISSCTALNAFGASRLALRGFNYACEDCAEAVEHVTKYAL